MKQFQFEYKNDKTFLKELEKIQWLCEASPSYTILFRIYSSDMAVEHIRHICDLLDEHMPDALYLGCTTHANLINGALSTADIVLSCTIFEYETTQVKILQLPFSNDSVKDTVGELKAYCAANPWVKCVELHATVLNVSLREFCEEMSVLKSDIQVFGGGAYNPAMDYTPTYVFSNGNGFYEQGVVFLLLGGNDFHVYSTYIAGWKPLTKHYEVTKAVGATLYELDGEPAFNIYQKYLNISRSSGSLVSNTLEFPLFMDYNGVSVLRCPLALNDDGSLVMATETPEGSNVRIAYGNPEMILSNIRDDAQVIANFQPDTVQTFSCAARRAFWGDENVSDETILFNYIAPTSGFYTSGEFLRLGSTVSNFNITLVLAAMREGEPRGGAIFNTHATKLDSIESEERIPLVRRFVSFIEVITQELEEANRELAKTSITDGLTGLYNRTEIERGIQSALKSRESNVTSLIMLDIDNFKKVNDTYGHKEGDRVIIALSDVIRQELTDVVSAYTGRWGGEEFMVLLPGVELDEASAYAEKIRASFAAVTYEKALPQTVSLGVAQVRDGEDIDSLCSRVDKALYMAKANGKNQVVKLT